MRDSDSSLETENGSVPDASSVRRPGASRMGLALLAGMIVGFVAGYRASSFVSGRVMEVERERALRLQEDRIHQVELLNAKRLTDMERDLRAQMRDAEISLRAENLLLSRQVEQYRRQAGEARSPATNGTAQTVSALATNSPAPSQDDPDGQSWFRRLTRRWRK